MRRASTTVSSCGSYEDADVRYGAYRLGEFEATPRFELGNRAFAELRLTTWLRRRERLGIASGWRESNPRVNLGKVAGYHYITPARWIGCIAFSPAL
jgi:hypothetical protein